MMPTLLIALTLLSAPQAPQTPTTPALAAIEAKGIIITPKPVAEFELSKLQGVIRRLAWNADGTELYLQTAELQSNAQPKTFFHYLVNPTTGALRKVDDEPVWAADYWKWKAGRSAPGDDKFSIELAVEQRRNSATALPMGGDYARGGTGGDPNTGASSESVMAVAQQSQSGTANLMKLKGQVIGEFLNLPIVPGQTYGWGPTGTGLVAYAETGKGALMVMDKNGTRQKIGDTRNVFTPSFTADATKLAWIEVRGKKAVLVTSNVGR